MVTFTPPVEPSVSGLSVATKTRTLVAEFGDGYTQRAGDGLNGIAKQVSVTWNALQTADADTIIAFFEARGGFEMFEWTPPRGNTALKWIVTEWQLVPLDSALDAISATFVQVFDL